MHFPAFINSLQAGLNYWQNRTADETEANITSLDKERHNLYRFMTYVEKVPELWPGTAVVILQAFYLVERRGYWREWMPYMEQAVSAWVPDDPVLQANLWNRLGYLYRLDRRLDEAVAAHKKAATLSEHAGSEESLYQAYFYLCGDYHHKFDHDLAEKYGQMALAGFSQAKEVNKWWAFVLNELGIVSTKQGNLSLARQKV